MISSKLGAVAELRLIFFKNAVKFVGESLLTLIKLRSCIPLISLRAFGFNISIFKASIIPLAAAALLMGDQPAA